MTQAERAFWIDHHEIDHAQGPDVSLYSESQYLLAVNALSNFGGHCVSASKHSSLNLLIAVFHFLAEAKVSNFENAIVNEDVLRLEVAMDDIVAMKFLYIWILTARPSIIWRRISMALASSNDPRCLMNSSSVPCLQYSITSILHLELE